MPTAEHAKLQYEAGQTAYAMAALSDSGDAATFEAVASPWSGRSGYEAVIRPDGLISGGAITPHVDDNKVTVAAGTAYIAGELVSFGAGTATITRATSTDTHMINAITIDGSGTIAAAAGTDSTAFSATRDAAGGPPLIATTKIEIGHIRTTSFTAAPVTQAEISQIPGTSQERYDSPVMTDIDEYLGTVTFGDALPLIHTGAVPKNVYASYAVPSFANVEKVKDFVPPENSRSVSSEQIYGGTIGSSSQSLGQGSFTAFLNNGVTDALVVLKDENLWFKFYPDRAASPHLMCQGYLGISRTFPAGAQMQAACTISADAAAQEIA